MSNEKSPSKPDDSSNPGNKYDPNNRVPEQFEKKGINKKPKNDLDEELKDSFPASDPNTKY